jgi:hypothetical protein
MTVDAEHEVMTQAGKRFFTNGLSASHAEDTGSNPVGTKWFMTWRENWGKFRGKSCQNRSFHDSQEWPTRSLVRNSWSAIFVFALHP